MKREERKKRSQTDLFIDFHGSLNGNHLQKEKKKRTRANLEKDRKCPCDIHGDEKNKKD